MKLEVSLPFTLLADTELNAIKAYDVWQEKNMYGKITMGVVRTSCLQKEDIPKVFLEPGDILF